MLDPLLRAFPRHAAQYIPKTGQFGQDRGYDALSPPEGRPCKTLRDGPNAYNDEHPMAVYFPGQKVVITHPTKVRQSNFNFAISRVKKNVTEI